MILVDLAYEMITLFDLKSNEGFDVLLMGVRLRPGEKPYEEIGRKADRRRRSRGRDPAFLMELLHDVQLGGATSLESSGRA